VILFSPAMAGSSNSGAGSPTFRGTSFSNPNEIVNEIVEAKNSRGFAQGLAGKMTALRGINLALTFTFSLAVKAVNISRMPELPLHIEDLPGSRPGIRVLRLAGPLTLLNVFGFQSQVRADDSQALILDFTNVPLVDSAGIGALVGAYVSRQKDGRSLGLVGVNRRINQALEVARVKSFFHFYGTVAEAEQAA
jgi:anti-sigma B factor antagonist